jgi:membrane protease YdiL (CAAX protease family)
MKNSNNFGDALKSPRSWLALAILVVAYFLDDPVQALLYTPLKHAANLHMIQDGAMSLLPYGVLMLVRLVWNAALLCAVWLALGQKAGGFPLRDRVAGRHLLIGLLIGLVVMFACIFSIIGLGNAQVFPSKQSLGSAMLHAAGWLIFGLIGAAGEELYGRAAVLLVAERFLGWRGAVVASGVMFFIFHLANPGASAIWLLRLCLQGMLLAYAVYRTRSIWWSIGYHAGWNWAGAPLFGSAGSGYLNEGHVYSFVPSGSDFITGGAIGPEGSVFAFVAVLAALGLLMFSTGREREKTAP